MHNEAVTCVALTRDKTCKEVTAQGRVEGLAELGGLNYGAGWALADNPNIQGGWEQSEV